MFILSNIFIHHQSSIQIKNKLAVHNTMVLSTSHTVVMAKDLHQHIKSKAEVFLNTRKKQKGFEIRFTVNSGLNCELKLFPTEA